MIETKIIATGVFRLNVFTYGTPSLEDDPLLILKTQGQSTHVMGICEICKNIIHVLCIALVFKIILTLTSFSSLKHWKRDIL